jgi:hypothetical protein
MAISCLKYANSLQHSDNAMYSALHDDNATTLCKPLPHEIGVPLSKTTKPDVDRRSIESFAQSESA